MEEDFDKKPIKKNKPTRVSTPIRKKQLIEALTKNLGVLTPSCKQAGIHHQTYYNWLKKDEKFKKEVDTIKEMAIDFVESKLFKQIADGNASAMMFYLKCQAKHRGYIERTENEHIIRPIDFKFGGDDEQKKLGEFGE